MGISVETGRLLWRLFVSYLLVIVLGSSFLFLNNWLMHDISWSRQLRFHIPFVLIGDAAMAVILLGITHMRLRKAFRAADSESLDGRLQAFRRLVRFPMELFVGMTIVALLLITLFHLSDWWMHPELWSRPGWWGKLVGSVLAELGLTLILGMLLFSVSRRQLRPCMEWLGLTGYTSVALARGSLVHQIVIAFAVCFVIAYAASFRYMAFTRSSASLDLGNLFLLMLAYTTFAVTVIVMFLLGIRNELRLLIGSLRQLGGAAGTGVRQPIPLASMGETGRLTEAFNTLQHHIVHTYGEVERQVKLAYEVQQRLLPRRLPEDDRVDMAASCEQCQEVGGDFYEAIRLNDGRLAVVIGDVSGKGMSAALLMSAVMAGLRMELPRGGDAGDILSRMNRHVCRMTQSGMYVTMGVAVLNRMDHDLLLDYASAGHLSPYLLRSGSWPAELACSSLPLGIDQDAVYTSSEWKLEENETLVLYTDGAVESSDGYGGMLGFDQWEEQLARMEGHLSASRQLSMLLAGLRMAHEPLQDDRTIVLLKRKAAQRGTGYDGIGGIRERVGING